MKTIIKLSTVMLLISNQLIAQYEKGIKNNEVEGFYITYSDFKKGKLIIPIDKQHKGDKIKLKQFFISPEIIAIEENNEIVFNKDSIFAIRLINGENYRFINRTPFLIADTSFLYIYSYKTTKTEYKQSGPHRRGKEIPITYYFFSLGNQKEAYVLTLTNLYKHAFIDAAIHTAVSNKFTTDEMLYKINSKTGRFELNEIILSVVKR